MDPFVLGTAIKAGGDFLSNLFGNPGYQTRTGYSNPQGHLNDLFGTLSNLSGALAHQASTPDVFRSSYAQGVPTFAGGGLPMPFGLSARDPALSDPSLLSNAANTLDFGGMNPFVNRTTAPAVQNTSGGGIDVGENGRPATGGDFGGSGNVHKTSVTRRPLGASSNPDDGQQMINALRLIGAKF